MRLNKLLQGVPKIPYKGFLGKNECYFQKLFLNFEIDCKSRPLKKEISILNHIAKLFV